MSYKKRTEYRRERADQMLQDIAAFLQSRFNANPELKQMTCTTHALCASLVAAGVSLFTFSDSAVSRFLTEDRGQVVRGYYDGRVWIFKRPAADSKTMNITIEQARKVLEVVNMGLVSGLGTGAPEPGRMCVEVAICYALGEPHGDAPECVAPSVRRFNIRLNDAAWSSDKARTEGMRKLAIAQLGSAGEIDEGKFAIRVAELTIRRVLPPILRKAGLEKEAARCETEGTFESARVAATAADAADADAADAADRRAYTAAYTAAADAADAAYTAAFAYAAAYTAAATYTAAAAAYAAAAAADAAADSAATAAAARASTYTYSAAARASTVAAAAAYTATYIDSLTFRDRILSVSAGCCLDALREINAPGIALLDELGI